MSDLPVIGEVILGGFLLASLAILVAVLLVCREVVRPDPAFERDVADASHLRPDPQGSPAAPEGETGSNLLSSL